MNLSDIKTELDSKGYVVINNVLQIEECGKALELFNDWIKTIPDFNLKHSKIDPHGIIKYWEVGQQEHAWFIRTRENIINIFKYIYDTDKVIVSFDGACYINPEEYKKKRDKVWTHTDQAPIKDKFECYQGFYSMTDNVNTSLVVYEGSHKLHNKYFKDRGDESKKNWNLIDIEYLEEIKDLRRVLKVDKNSLVIWDSRTFHQNQYGYPNCETRIVQYISYMPRNHPKYTKAQREKRTKYVFEYRTTSHWAVQPKVNSLQPRTFGNATLLIDYDKLRKPNLKPYLSEMVELI